MLDSFISKFVFFCDDTIQEGFSFEFMRKTYKWYRIYCEKERNTLAKETIWNFIGSIELHA